MLRCTKGHGGLDVEQFQSDTCCWIQALRAIRETVMALMQASTDAGLWHALNSLETGYWYEVDFNGGVDAHEYYVADGLFAVGDNRFEGHDNIRAFYAWRQRRGPMTTRHLISNVQVIADGEGSARIVAVLSLFRANGRPPITGAKPPCLIADIAADCVRGDDGMWRYRSHIVTPIFIGSDIPLSISIDTKILSERRSDLVRQPS